MRRGLVLALVLGAAAAASAHVAPSVDDNNRYLKLTPLGDRVRLAYVIFYGELPGARLRPTLDADHDGAISEAEGQAFGAKVGAEVAAALDVSIDGAQQRLAWSSISVGLGSPGARGRHALRLFDRLRLPRPGELEVKIEDSPGVRIERAKVGDRSDPSGVFRFGGPGGALSDDGLELAFTAGDAALAPADGACRAADGPRHGPPAGVIAGAAVALGCAGAAAVALRRRRRHSART
jgi:hypothetical protein